MQTKQPKQSKTETNVTTNVTKKPDKTEITGIILSKSKSMRTRRRQALSNSYSRARSNSIKKMTRNRKRKFVEIQEDMQENIEKSNHSNENKSPKSIQAIPITPAVIKKKSTTVTSDHPSKNCKSGCIVCAIHTKSVGLGEPKRKRRRKKQKDSTINSTHIIKKNKFSKTSRVQKRTTNTNKPKKKQRNKRKKRHSITNTLNTKEEAHQLLIAKKLRKLTFKKTWEINEFIQTIIRNKDIVESNMSKQNILKALKNMRRDKKNIFG